MCVAAVAKTDTTTASPRETTKAKATTDLEFSHTATHLYRATGYICSYRYSVLQPAVLFSSTFLVVALYTRITLFARGSVSPRAHVPDTRPTHSHINQASS